MWLQSRRAAYRTRSSHFARLINLADKIKLFPAWVSYRGVARIFPGVRTNFRNPLLHPPPLPNPLKPQVVSWLRLKFRCKPTRFLLCMKWRNDVSYKILAPFFLSSTEKHQSLIIDSTNKLVSQTSIYFYLLLFTTFYMNACIWRLLNFAPISWLYHASLLSARCLRLRVYELM